MKPSGDRVRSEVNVGEGKNVISLRCRRQATRPRRSSPPQVEAGDLYGHAKHGRSNGGGHLVLEDLEEPRHLLVGVVGIDGDLLDEPGERLHHGGRFCLDRTQ